MKTPKGKRVVYLHKLYRERAELLNLTIRQRACHLSAVLSHRISISVLSRAERSKQGVLFVPDRKRAARNLKELAVSFVKDIQPLLWIDVFSHGIVKIKRTHTREKVGEQDEYTGETMIYKQGKGYVPAIVELPQALVLSEPIFTWQNGERKRAGEKHTYIGETGHRRQWGAVARYVFSLFSTYGDNIAIEKVTNVGSWRSAITPADILQDIALRAWYLHCDGALPKEREKVEALLITLAKHRFIDYFRQYTVTIIDRNGKEREQGRRYFRSIHTSDIQELVPGEAEARAILRERAE